MDKVFIGIRDKNRFLSVRVSLCVGSLFLLFILSLIAHIASNPLLSALLLIIAVIDLIVFIIWVVRPFLRNENKIRRIIAGYMVFEPHDRRGVVLTPATEEMADTVYGILNSDQTVRLNKRQAQYLALQNQINPHFLYNTLDGIRSEALIAGVDSIADMTEALATFFRYTISNVENLVTIEDELDNCRTYFSIQQYRFGERLGLSIEAEEGLGRYLIPKLTLQPILENSIIHGTEMKTGKGLTVISIRRTDLRIIIDIKDDGVGMDEETLEKLNRKLDTGVENMKPSDRETGGIALVNVNNRIHLLFGQEYGLHVFSMKDLGTAVEISIPAVTEESRKKKGASDGA